MILLAMPFSEASALTDSVKVKIEYWWQGYNAVGIGQVTERIQSNNANYSGTTTPVGRTYGAFKSHNDSTEYFPTVENSVLSSYSRFGIENIKDDLSGWWCASFNVTSKANLDKAIVGISMGTGAGRSMTFIASDSLTNVLKFESDAGGLGRLFTFGAIVAGQKTFACMGNTGETFWGFQDGANKTLTFTSGTNGGLWYGNVSGYTNGTFAAMTDFNYRLVFDESDMQIDFIYYGNGTPTTEELVELWNGTTLGSDPLNYTNVFGGAAAPAASANNLTVTAQDAYDSMILTNFTLNITGLGNNFSISTLNGTIEITNITHGFYNLTFSSGANGSYFTSRYFNVNVSGQNFKGNLTQSYLNVYVNDSLTKVAISSFSYVTNFTSLATVSGGYVLLKTKAGSNHYLNVSSSQYPQQAFTYSILAGENNSMTINMSPRFQFYLKREADNSLFDINGTNTTRLTVICPNKNQIIYFKNESSGASPTSKVSTQENLTIDCDYSYIKMDVTYSDSSYFRTLIPPISQQNITWWLLDLNKDTGVQKILELVDLTGDWSSGKLKLTTPIGNNNEEIITQLFDVSIAVTLYLLKDNIYTVVLINNDGSEERQLGTLIADTAGTVTLIYPNIPFYPENTLLEDNISWSYTCPFSQCPPPYNTSDNILRLTYLDTINGTNSITWSVYNGTNTTRLLQQFTSASHSVTFTYQPAIKNSTYYTELFVQNTILGFNITDNQAFGDYELSVLPGFTRDEQQEWVFYMSGIFLVVWGMLFSAYHVGIGLASTFVFAVIFRVKGWLPINVIWLALIGFVAIITFIYEGIKKD